MSKLQSFNIRWGKDFFVKQKLFIKSFSFVFSALYKQLYTFREQLFTFSKTALFFKNQNFVGKNVKAFFKEFSSFIISPFLMDRIKRYYSPEKVVIAKKRVYHVSFLASKKIRYLIGIGRWRYLKVYNSFFRSFNWITPFFYLESMGRKRLYGAFFRKYRRRDAQFFYYYFNWLVKGRSPVHLRNSFLFCASSSKLFFWMGCIRSFFVKGGKFNFKWS